LLQQAAQFKCQAAVFFGSACKNNLMASNPPADAPMPTTGNWGFGDPAGAVFDLLIKYGGLKT
jgi:hypothetical protein